MIDLTIRQASQKDAEALAMLLTELNLTVGIGGLPPGPDREIENALVTAETMAARLRAVEGLEWVLLGEAGGQPAGFAAVRLTPYLDQDVPYAELTQIHVRPEFRRRGYASRLLSAVEDFAREHGATSVHLVANHDNYDAHGFYRGAGYEPLYVGFEKFLQAEGQAVHA